MSTPSRVLAPASLALALTVSFLAGAARSAPPDTKPLPVGNATCPVKGTPVDPKVTLVWNDLEIAFCCADCPAKFQADPLKYVPALLRDLATQLVAAKARKPGDKNAAGEPRSDATASPGGALVDLGNAKCPVMGGAAKPAVFAVHHGMKVRFCCPGCDAKFRADPAKYLGTLRAEPEVARRIEEAEAAWAARGGR